MSRRRPTFGRPLGPALAGAACWALLHLLLAAPATAAGAPEIRVFLESEVVPAGGTVAFRVEVTGTGITQPRLTPSFELHNLQVIGRPTRDQNLTLGDGRGRWTFAWTWFLRALSEGEASVTSLRVLVGTEVHDLPPRYLQVTPAAAESPSATTPETPEIFLHAEVVPSEPFVGQRTLYRAYLYQRAPVRLMRYANIPTFEGCWSRAVDLTGTRPLRVLVGGVWYERRTLIARELYPLRAGTLDLGRLSAGFLVERLRRSRFRLAPFRVQETLFGSTNPVLITVRPLPDGDNPLAERFTGAVGSLSVDTRLESGEVAVGHAAALTVTVEGDGHLEGLPAPPLRTPPTVQVLGPQELEPDPESETEGATTTAKRVWRYLLVPQQVGSWPISPVEITYFDPATESYRLASAPVPDLAARPEGADTHGPVPASVGAGLRPIRSAALPGPAPRRWTRLLPWAFGVPWLLALALLAARETGVRLPRRPGAGSARQILQGFREELHRAASEDRPRRAAAGIERAWRHLLTQVFGLPEGEAASVWVDSLEDREVSEEARQRLAALLEDLHFLRYAPELSDTVSLAGELVGRSERLARELLR